MRKLSPLLSVLVLISWAGATEAQTLPSGVVFDSIHTKPGFKDPILGVSTAKDQNKNLIQSFVGQAFDLGNVNTAIGGPLNITGLDFYVGEIVPVDYANVQVRIQLYDLYTGVTPDVNSTSNVFANPIANPSGAPGPTWVQDLGAIQASSLTKLTNDSGEVLEHLSFITADSPNGLTVGSLSNLGIVISFGETTTPGGPLTTSTNVTAGIRLSDNPPTDPGGSTSHDNSPYAIGSNPGQWSSHDNNYLYFRNNTGNPFIGTDGNDFGPGSEDLDKQFFSGLALIMYGQGAAVIPEPSSSALLVAGMTLGLVGFAIGRRRQSLNG